MGYFNKFLETYRPDEVSFIFNGLDLTTGLDPNSHVVVRRNTKKYTFVPDIGGEGHGARLLNSDNSATIIVKLFSTSQVHKILYKLYKEDDGNNSGSISSFTFNDKRNNGMAYQEATNVWIADQQEVDYSDQVKSISWEFMASDLQPLDTQAPVEESIPMTV